LYKGSLLLKEVLSEVTSEAIQPSTHVRHVNFLILIYLLNYLIALKLAMGLEPATC